MKPAPFEYLAPATIAETVAALAQHGDDAKVLALIDEQRSGYRGIDSAGHGDEDSFAHQPAAANCRDLMTRAGKTSATWSMDSSVVSAPRLIRTAADARSGLTPIAVSTWDGEMLPL